MAEVVANGVRLHVQRLGEGGAPVVFVHGLVMDNLSSWYFSVANGVAARQEVVLYDLRGHGYSERPQSGYQLETFVADLTALLPALSINQPVHLVGNSFGGLLAIVFGVSHPEKIRSLCLVDALLPEPGWGESMVVTLALTGEERDGRIAENFKHWLGRHSSRKRNRLARQAQALVEGTSLISDLRSSAGIGDQQLASLTCPVLGIYGEDSDQRQQADKLAALLPDFHLEMFPGCSHSVLWQETARVRETIAAWVQS